MQIVKKTIEKFVAPYFNELTSYAMSITTLLLIIVNFHFKLHQFTITPPWSPKTTTYFITFIISFGCALALPIYHVFVKKKKTELYKFLIQLFSIVMNIVVGLYSLSYVYENNKKWLYVFPFWNFLNALIFPMLIKYDIISIDKAFEKDATLGEIFVSTLFLGIIFYECQFVYNLVWGLTFSICVICVTTLNRLLNFNSIDMDTA